MRPNRIVLYSVAVVAAFAVACGSATNSTESTSKSSVAAAPQTTKPVSTHTSPKTAATTETTAAPATPSVAEKLATIQTESPVEADDPLVRKFDTALSSLGKKCKERGMALADMTVAVQQALAKDGIDQSLIRTITDVNASIPSGLGRMPCSSTFAAYLVLRQNE